MSRFFVYILKCADNSFYVGRTQNIDNRTQRHNEGLGGTYTAARRPVTLLYSEEFSSLQGAVAREQQLKRWTREKKAALISGNLASLKGTSARQRQNRK